MEIKKEDILKDIAEVSKKSSLEVFVVGGFVRDQLLERPLKKDIDVVVSGSGIEFANAFAEHMGEDKGSVVLFEDFDTARFVYTREVPTDIEEEIKKEVLFELEFAGARKEAYEEGSRKPNVEPATIEEDLSRRDFTVNAMARKVLPGGELGEIIDPYKGQKHLEDRILVTPLDPDETFHEDPLRMMRVARFAAQLNFKVKEAVLLSIHRNRKRLSIISKERIQEELMKMMGTPRPSTALFLLHATKLMDEFLPEVTELAGVEEVKGYSHKDNLSHTFAVVDNIAELGGSPILCFAGLMHDIAKPETKSFDPKRGWTFDMHEHLGKKMTKDIMRRLKFSSKHVKYVSRLVRWHLQPIALMDKGVTDSPVRRLIVNLKDDLDDLLLLCRADITTGNQKKKVRRLKNYDYLEQRIDEVMEIDKLRAFQSPVRGEEIMHLCELKPGPTVGKIKKQIEEAILDGIIPNEYEDALRYFYEIKPEYMKDALDWEKA